MWFMINIVEAIRWYFLINNFRGACSKRVKVANKAVWIRLDETTHHLKTDGINNIEDESNKKDDKIIERVLNKEENKLVHLKGNLIS